MNKALLQLAVACGLVAAGSLCFHRFASDTLSTEESRLRLLPVAVGEYLQGVTSSTDLDTRLESNYRRVQAKYAVVTELVAGRLTLLDAAARFRDLDAGLPDVRDRLMEQYPGVPYAVALCRHVIEHARSVLRVQAPEQVASVVARLEAELQAQLECETDLRLR
jgi:hypothetical protein